MTTRRTVLQGAGVIGLATAFPMNSDPANLPLYTGVRYQGWTPLAPFDHAMFIQRFESRNAVDFKIVGASLHGGHWTFISDHEAENHVQAIWNAAMVEKERVRLRHQHGAERAIAAHIEMGLSHDAGSIRAHHEVLAERQIKTYLASVKSMMEERRALIGPSHPTMATELFARYQSSSAMV